MSRVQDPGRSEGGGVASQCPPHEDLGGNEERAEEARRLQS